MATGTISEGRKVRSFVYNGTLDSAGNYTIPYSTTSDGKDTRFVRIISAGVSNLTSCYVVPALNSGGVNMLMFRNPSDNSPLAEGTSVMGLVYYTP